MRFISDKYDERQLQIRGSVAMQTVLLTMVLLLIGFTMSDWLSAHIALEDLILITFFIINLFFCESLLLRDAYVAMCNTTGFRRLMILMLVAFLAYVGVAAFGICTKGLQGFMGEDLIGMFPAVVCGIISISYFVKARLEKGDQS